MDVRFCEGRNHGREAKMQAVDRQNLSCALLKGAREEKCVFLLTSTYMEVGDPESTAFDTWPNGG
jgi:hypothetical protein